MTTMRPLQQLQYLIVYPLLALAIEPRLQAGTAPGPSGTWTWTTPLAKGIPERRHVLTLKLEGDALTGALSSPGATRSGNATPITAARFFNDAISFTVTRQFGTNAITQRFSGRLINDIIKGDITFDISGKTNTAPWTAKREPEGGTQEPSGRPKGVVSRPGNASPWQFPTVPRRANQNSSPPAASTNRAQ
jgi:hypothetical protein